MTRIHELTRQFSHGDESKRMSQEHAALSAVLSRNYAPQVESPKTLKHDGEAESVTESRSEGQTARNKNGLGLSHVQRVDNDVISIFDFLRLCPAQPP